MRYCECCNVEIRAPRAVCEWCEEMHEENHWDDLLEFENEQVFQDHEGEV